MKVLVADEDIANRNLILNSLVDPDLQPICAFDGVPAWELLSRMNPPRLAILGPGSCPTYSAGHHPATSGARRQQLYLRGGSRRAA